MSTLLISDKLFAPKGLHVDWSGWTASRPSAEGYEHIILDLFFGSPGKNGYISLGESYDKAHFFELGSEIAKSLKAGGVVTALLGPIAHTTRDLNKHYAKDALPDRSSFQYYNKFVEGQIETSYDWLDQGFLQETMLDCRYAKESTGITVVWRHGDLANCISRWANKYWISIAGLSYAPKSGIDGRIHHEVGQWKRWDTHIDLYYSYKVLAIGKHSQLPVAVAMRYLDWDGTLLLLPPFARSQFTEPAASEEASSLLYALNRISADIKEAFSHIPTHEDWVYENRPNMAKTISMEIEKLTKERGKLEQDLSDFDKMLSLIDGTGKPLEDVVIALFTCDDRILKVQRTGKGAPIDLFVTDDTGRSLAIEITGISGVLKIGDPHWGDFLGYIPEHNAKNERGRVERIVLVVNTQCKTKLEQRNRNSDISSPVKKTVNDNNICVIRSCDLYDLWVDMVEGRKKIQDIFDILFSRDGIWEPG